MINCVKKNYNKKQHQRLQQNYYTKNNAKTNITKTLQYEEKKPTKKTPTNTHDFSLV